MSLIEICYVKRRLRNPCIRIIQAMEMLKVSKVSSSSTTGYENYFEAFLEEKTNYIPVEDEQREDETLKQVLPYIFFLLSPICILLVIIARKTI